VAEAPTTLLAELTDRVHSEFGFRLDPTHVALSGTCGKCSNDRQESDTPGDPNA
jgi:Fur family ferric uptake transcriptional regulator